MDTDFGHVSSLSPCYATGQTLTRSARYLENVFGHDLIRDFVENIP
jgi:hypothetical protein